MKTNSILIVLATILGLSPVLADENLLSNGDFHKTEGGKVANWITKGKVSVEKHEEKMTLVIQGSYAMAKQIVKLDPSWKSLRLSARMKATAVEVGDAAWKDARIAMSFKGSDGKRAGGWPKVFNARGTTDWIKCERDYDIPKGAVSLELMPVNFGKSGKVEFQEIILLVDPPKMLGKPIIILKLDDVTSVSQSWQKCAEFLGRERVKASFGIIGAALEKDKPTLTKWVKELHESGRIEFWNHGYKLRTSKDKIGEFESDSADDQLKALRRTQELAKERFGITLRVFGPHWSNTNASTVQALKQIPEIKGVFFYTKCPDRQWFVFQRYHNIEIPLMKPNFEAFKKKFEASAHRRPYLALQGHPNAWSKDDRFDQFQKIVRYLKANGCEFMTASEYLKHRKK